MTRPGKALAAATALVAALTLAGCGDDESSGDDGKITLTFSSYAFQGPTVAATEEIVDSWNAAHPDVQVDYQKVDPASVHDKLVTQFAGESAPDVIHDEAADIAGFGRQGYLADLTDLRSDDLTSDIAEGVWESVTVEDQVIGIPTIAQVYTVFANLDALAAAGVEPPTADAPWTWDDLVTNAQTLTSGGTTGFAWGLSSPVSAILSTGLAFDATYVSGDEAKPELEVGDAELEVPTRLRTMLDAQTMAPNSVSLAGTDVLPAFFDGQYAMVMAGNYVATQIAEKAPEGFNWTMLPLLEGTSQSQASNPQTLSVARQSEHPEEAMEFIEYYLEAENLAKIAIGDALIPVTASATEAVKTELGDDHGWAAILDSAPDLVNPPWQKADAYPEWKSDIATPAFQEFLAGEIDEDTLADRLTEGWEEVNQ
jgi:ABC-type glycerol-3-phosphate transport system substrate-binding protein